MTIKNPRLILGVLAVLAIIGIGGGFIVYNYSNKGNTNGRAGAYKNLDFKDYSKQPLPLFRDVLISARPGMSAAKESDTSWIVESCVNGVACSYVRIIVEPSVHAETSLRKYFEQTYSVRICLDTRTGGDCTSATDEIPYLANSQQINLEQGSMIKFTVPDIFIQGKDLPRHAYSFYLRGRSMMFTDLSGGEDFAEKLASSGWSIDANKKEETVCSEGPIVPEYEDTRPYWFDTTKYPVADKYHDSKLGIFGGPDPLMDGDILARVFTASDCGDDRLREVTGQDLTDSLSFGFGFNIQPPISEVAKASLGPNFVCSVSQNGKWEDVACDRALSTSGIVRLRTRVEDLLRGATVTTVGEAAQTKVLLPYIKETFQN